VIVSHQRSMSNRLAGMQQSSMPYPSSSSGWHPPTAISTDQGSGTSSQAARGKRRRRLSSDDQWNDGQDYGEDAWGRTDLPPPTRRQRMESEPEPVSNFGVCLCSSLMSFRTGTHPQAARYRPKSEVERWEVSSPRGTLRITEILSPWEDKQLTT
jgi:hypothetical protein